MYLPLSLTLLYCKYLFSRNGSTHLCLVLQQLISLVSVLISIMILICILQCLCFRHTVNFVVLSFINSVGSSLKWLRTNLDNSVLDLPSITVVLELDNNRLVTGDQAHCLLSFLSHQQKRVFFAGIAFGLGI